MYLTEIKTTDGFWGKYNRIYPNFICNQTKKNSSGNFVLFKLTDSLDLTDYYDKSKYFINFFPS